MVISPEKRTQFLIDVKGQLSKSYWLIARKDTRENLFYVLALVPTGKPNQFFIMTQDAVNAGIAAEFGRLSQERQQLGERKNMLGLRWRDAVDHLARIMHEG